jgi:hypothetical protein
MSGYLNRKSNCRKAVERDFLWMLNSDCKKSGMNSFSSAENIA